ncbi:Tetraspanin, partial [Caligus rogercresseyi]
RRNSVPDSCCHIVIEGCGHDILLNHESASQDIFVHGCLTVLREKLINEVVPICLGYTGIGTIIALIQIIIAVLAFSRNANIQRKKKYASSHNPGASGRNYKSNSKNIMEIYKCTAKLG